MNLRSFDEVFYDRLLEMLSKVLNWLGICTVTLIFNICQENKTLLLTSSKHKSIACL